jgi:hypothetical protein
MELFSVREGSRTFTASHGGPWPTYQEYPRDRQTPGVRGDGKRTRETGRENRETGNGKGETGRGGRASPRLLSDVWGRVTHVCLALPTYQAETLRPLLACVAGVTRALGPAVRCSVLCHAGDEPLLAGLVPARRLDLVPWGRSRTIQIAASGYRIEDGVLRLGRLPWGDFTPWVQDSFLVASRDGAPCLLASPAVARPGGGADEDVPHVLARHLGWRAETFPVPFEAANVLVDQRRVVLGAAVGRTLPPRSAAVTLRRLFAPAGALLRVPPRSAQPASHQDMYLTLAGPGPGRGRAVALVGSTPLAARVLGRRHEPTAESRGLERVARAMEAAGYEVIRLPYARTPLLPFRQQSVVTYNNALVEVWPRRGGRLGRRVTLPRFGTDGGPAIVELDHAAAEVWRGLGFRVRFADGPFTWLGLFEGSVRCLTKVLARGARATTGRRSGRAS